MNGKHTSLETNSDIFSSNVILKYTKSCMRTYTNLHILLVPTAMPLNTDKKSQKIVHKVPDSKQCPTRPVGDQLTSPKVESLTAPSQKPIISFLI